MEHFSKTKMRPKKFEEKLLDIGFLRSRNCISASTWGHIYYVSTSRQWSPYWKSYMRKAIIVILEGGPNHIEPSPYWWPGMQRVVQDYVRKCDQCQRYAPNIHQPKGILNPLSSPWPFSQWGLDIVGPFSRAVGN